MPYGFFLTDLNPRCKHFVSLHLLTKGGNKNEESVVYVFESYGCFQCCVLSVTGCPDRAMAPKEEKAATQPAAETPAAPPAEQTPAAPAAPATK